MSNISAAASSTFTPSSASTAPPGQPTPLGKLSQLKELRLAAWVHMLGFRGHFSTKSRAYPALLATVLAKEPLP